MQQASPIKVLIVDDSPFARSMLTRALAAEEDIVVVGGAKDPFDARELIIELHPDVIILDLVMPRMDGITFLEKLREHYPVPVIMCSGVIARDGAEALRALELGAVDVIAKPSTGGSAALPRFGEELADKIRAAHLALPNRPRIPGYLHRKPTAFKSVNLDPAHYLVALGASTGGTEAIKNVLTRVPPDFPPMVMVQHMPEGFTRSFADRLDQLSPLRVKEAKDGDLLLPGCAFLARGGTQMAIAPAGDGRWRIAYGDHVPVNRHCPSVEVLFDSVARYVGPRAVGVLLTGMGADGAEGLLRMRQAGALTIAQNHASSVVFGMPKVAIELGAAERITSPHNVPAIILASLTSRIRTTTPSRG